MSDDGREGTRIGGAPPVAPQLPDAAGRTSGEATHRGAQPPVLPRPSTPPEAGPSAAAADGEETVYIEQSAGRVPFSLQRIEPPGHRGVVYLDGRTYLLGRKHGADLPLFSPTASREHARLERRVDGWYLEPCADKTVMANGALVRSPLRLEHDMRLRLGGDELIFCDEGVAAAAVHASDEEPPVAVRRGRWRVLLWVALAAAGAAGLLWVLAGG